MSAKASAYAKELVVCPSGERITRGEKLVLIVLADNHQDKAKRFTYPSVETIAADALCDRRTCQRHLGALEEKGVIVRLRPANQGSGMTVFYFFKAFDVIPEGWQNAALFVSVGSAKKGGGRAAEGRHKGGIPCIPSIKNINQNEELKAIPPNPQAADAAGGAEGFCDVEGGAIEHALTRVCDKCAFTAKRLEKKLRAVIRQQVRTTGKDAESVADAMIDAWERYAKQGLRLFKRVSAAQFFETGMWLNSNSWDWDANFIREERLQGGARVGSIQ